MALTTNAVHIWFHWYFDLVNYFIVWMEDNEKINTKLVQIQILHARIHAETTRHSIARIFPFSPFSVLLLFLLRISMILPSCSSYILVILQLFSLNFIVALCVFTKTEFSVVSVMQVQRICTHYSQSDCIEFLVDLTNCSIDLMRGILNCNIVRPFIFFKNQFLISSRNIVPDYNNGI